MLNNPDNLDLSHLPKWMIDHINDNDIIIETVDKNGNVNCKYCTNCIDCIGCIACESCIACEYCTCCKKCKFCEDCNDCEECDDRIDYKENEDGNRT